MISIPGLNPDGRPNEHFDSYWLPELVEHITFVTFSTVPQCPMCGRPKETADDRQQSP